MIAAGIPVPLAKTLAAHWKAQVRHVKFDGLTTGVVLRTTVAHPQGSPWGPAIIQLWMISGVLWAKKRLREVQRSYVEGGDSVCAVARAPKPKRRRTQACAACASEVTPLVRKRQSDSSDGQSAKKRRTTTKVYMDNGSVVADEPGHMLDGVVAWEEWSQKVKLRENASKKQLVAKGAQAQQELQQTLDARGLKWNKFVVPEAEVLGTTIGNTALSEKENERCTKFEQRAKLIDILPINRRKIVVFKQSLAMSTLAYGWVFRVPLGRYLNTCTRKMRGNLLKKCNPQLQGVLEANIVPAVVILARLLNMTMTALAVSEDTTAFRLTKQTLHSVTLLRKLMADVGFREEKEFV